MSAQILPFRPRTRRAAPALEENIDEVLSRAAAAALLRAVRYQDERLGALDVGLPELARRRYAVVCLAQALLSEFRASPQALADWLEACAGNLRAPSEQAEDLAAIAAATLAVEGLS